MAQAKQTVASTNARVDELLAQIEELGTAVSHLQTQLSAIEAAPVAPRQPADEQFIWVSDKFAKVDLSTKGNRWATFTGRTGNLNSETGERSYGEYMTFKVFDDALVDIVESMLAGDNRLVALTATAKTREYKGKQYTDHIVESLRVIARPTAQVEQVEAVF
jgi:hypothetical protein